MIARTRYHILFCIGVFLGISPHSFAQNAPVISLATIDVGGGVKSGVNLVLEDSIGGWEGVVSNQPEHPFGPSVNGQAWVDSELARMTLCPGFVGQTFRTPPVLTLSLRLIGPSQSKFGLSTLVLFAEDDMTCSLETASFLTNTPTPRTWQPLDRFERVRTVGGSAFIWSDRIMPGLPPSFYRVSYR